jgi:hypothetical protein
MKNMKWNFFREPDHSTGARARMIAGIVGVGMALGLVVAFADRWPIALLVGLFFLHYLLRGMAEQLPRQQVQAAGILRILSLVASVGGLIAVIVLMVIFA